MNTVDSDKALALLRQASTAALTGMMYKKHRMRGRAVAKVWSLARDACRMVGRAYTIRYVPQCEDLNVASDLGHPSSLLLRAMRRSTREMCW
jgi:hypothetical protein